MYNYLKVLSEDTIMNNDNKMKAALLCLSTNTWLEDDNTDEPHEAFELFSPKLRCDKVLWNEYTVYLRDCGINTLIINLGDGVRYESHPELAVEGALSVDELKRELSRLKKLGFEVIPMLNFSAAHDIWLGDYAHMIATVPYYRVCADLIDEVCEIFEAKYFHIGMDSESFETQKDFFYVAVRHKELWWHDVYFFVDRILGNGARAIIFTDKMKEAGNDAFFNGLPPSVIASPVYDGSEDSLDRIKAICDAGYDLFPIGIPDDALNDAVSDDHFLGAVAVNEVILDRSRHEQNLKSADAARR